MNYHKLEDALELLQSYIEEKEGCNEDLLAAIHLIERAKDADLERPYVASCS